MAKILLIETATEVCSVALAVNGLIVAEAEELVEPKHAERLTPLIQQCSMQAGLALHQLDAVAVSRGPGSYTALRVGVSTAKGICFALDKPLIAIDTLQALAAASLSSYKSDMQDTGLTIRALPMLDARRQEVWTAAYDRQLRLVTPAQPLILSHEMFYEFIRSIPDSGAESVFVVSGNGAKKLDTARIFEKAVFSSIQNCSARHLSVIAESIFQKQGFQSITYFEPDYMKPPNITTPNKPLF